MKPRTVFLAGLAVALLFAGNAMAQDFKGPPWFSAARCTHRLAMRADTATGDMKDWASAYRVFRRYSVCDDGAVAEGFSDKIVILLALHWPSVPELAKLIQKDPVFGRFVIDHIDQTADFDQEKMIVAHARKECPSGLEKLCARLETKATNP